jgi:uncharacterized protein YuzE
VSIKIAGIEFDRIAYDAPVDVLYLHVGDPAADREWDETAEGDGVSYAPDGSLVGLTILNARRRLEGDGEISITLPEQRIVARDLGDALLPA